MSAKNVENPARLDMGIEGLNDVLSGGLPPHHIYLIEGSPGTGKTTIALQFLLAGLRKGESVLYVTLSETKEELHEVARSHGWSLDGVTLLEMTPPEDTTVPEGQYTFFHPSEVELGTTTKTLTAEVLRLKPNRVVFDSLSEMRLLAGDPLRYRRQVLALKQFFVAQKCTVLLLDDLTSSDADLQPQSLAHGVILLEQLAPEYGAERRRLRVLKLRGCRFRGGYHDFTITTGGVQIFPRLIATEHAKPFARDVLSSGVPELDATLGGGVQRGSSTLLLGPAGAGKSSVAAAWAVAAARRGERASVFLFDEGERTYVERLEGLGWNVKELIAQGMLRLKQVDPAELAPGEFAHLVRESVEKQKSRVLIIDSLSGYLHAMPAERYLILHMHELLAYLNQLGVATFLLVAQHGLVGNMGGAAGIDVSYIADTVVLLRYFEAQGRVLKALAVLKKRTGLHENTIRQFALSSRGLEVGAPLENFHGVLSGIPDFAGDGDALIGGHFADA